MGVKLRREFRIIYVILKSPSTDGGTAGISFNKELPVLFWKIENALTRHDIDYLLFHREESISALFGDDYGTLGVLVEGVSERSTLNASMSKAKSFRNFDWHWNIPRHI